MNQLRKYIYNNRENAEIFAEAVAMVCITSPYFLFHFIGGIEMNILFIFGFVGWTALIGFSVIRKGGILCLDYSYWGKYIHKDDFVVVAYGEFNSSSMAIVDIVNDAALTENDWKKIEAWVGSKINNINKVGIIGMNRYKLENGVVIPQWMIKSIAFDSKKTSPLESIVGFKTGNNIVVNAQGPQ